VSQYGKKHPPWAHPTPYGILFKNDGCHLLCGIDIGIQESMVIGLLAIGEKLK
jgi:hypothetical protein